MTMEWIMAERDTMRGDIESLFDFTSRNVQWWWINRRFERVRRRKFYEKFLAFGDIKTDETQVVCEVGPGPFGGMLEVMKMPAKRKVFVDYILEELYNLHYINWPDDALMVTSAAEAIPLEDNCVDVLISYNTLDHGWDIYQCIRECVRVSKKCYLAFDCRGDNDEQVDIREDGHDLDHHQLLKYADIAQFVFEQGMNSGQDEVWQIEDMKIKQFPVAFIMVEKKC